MKKFLAICLTLAMLLSCFTVVSFAAKKPAAPTHPVTYINSCDSQGTGVDIGGVGAVDTEEKTEGEGSWSTEINGTAPGSLWFSYKFPSNPIDTTEMTHLCFDIYVSDASKLGNTPFEFELSSGGQWDKKENAVLKNLSEIINGDGWSTVALPLTTGLFNRVYDGGCDFTNVNAFRFYNALPFADGIQGVVFKIDNIRFEDRGIKFTPVDDEAEYIYSKQGDNKYFNTDRTNGDKYYMDTNGYLIYRFELPEADVPYITGVQFTAKMGAQLLFQASSDGFNWTTIYNYGTPADGGSAGLAEGVYTSDLSPALDFTVSNEVWIKIADSYSSKGNGWGGNLFRVPAMLTWSYGTRVQRATTDYYKFLVRETERTAPTSAADTSEAQYLVSTNAGKTGAHDSYFRFNDHNLNTVYKFEITNPTDIANISVSGKFGSEMKIEVSTDNITWTTAFAGTLASIGPNTFDLTSAVKMKELEETGVLYVKFGDHHPYFVEGDKCAHGTPVEATAVCEECTTKLGDLNGNGGRIYGGGLTVLSVTHNPPPVEMAGAVAALRRVFNSFELLKVCPFLSRFFGQQIEMG